MAYLVHRNPRLVFLTLVILTCILIRDIVISVWISSDKALCVDIDAERIEMTSSLNTSFCDAMIDQKTDGNISQSCSPLEFIANLNEVLVSRKRHVPLHLLRRCSHVFYNRVPKCGSRSLYDTFITLGEKRGVTVRKKAMGIGRDPTSRLHKINPYIEQLQKMTGCQIIAKHLYFINLPRISKKPIIMINVLREPLDQLISVYSWKRFGDATNDFKGPTATNSTMSLDDCIAANNVSDSCFYWQMLAFPFLCQHSEGCWERHEPNMEQLQRAKWHIDNSFLLVGITEDMTSFLGVLEIMLPQFFSGVGQVYEENSKYLYTAAYGYVFE
ncbi:hypothetical protein LSH36_143g06046 [Paralvinella palmiformis]|uniref:Uncharacterized protein n=1 Tax=Paralvinella palmiformis TaxID=53620 RepID=A0AAD9N931_9ANNE|nr:hypothetical protein LSH36_143g06046 [Paralvinella palmiformis]